MQSGRKKKNRARVFFIDGFDDMYTRMVVLSPEILSDCYAATLEEMTVIRFMHIISFYSSALGPRTKCVGLWHSTGAKGTGLKPGAKIQSLL